MIICTKLLWLIDPLPIVGGRHELRSFDVNGNACGFFQSLIRQNPLNKTYQFLLASDRAVFMRHPLVVLDLQGVHNIRLGLEMNEVLHSGRSISFDVSDQLLMESRFRDKKLELQEESGPFFHEMWAHSLYPSAKVSWGNGI